MYSKDHAIAMCSQAYNRLIKGKKTNSTRDKKADYLYGVTI